MLQLQSFYSSNPNENGSIEASKDDEKHKGKVDSSDEVAMYEWKKMLARINCFFFIFESFPLLLGVQFGLG